MPKQPKYEDRLLIINKRIILSGFVADKLPVSFAQRKKVFCKEGNLMKIRDVTIDEKGHVISNLTSGKGYSIYSRYDLETGYYKFEINKYGEIIINLEDFVK